MSGLTLAFWNRKEDYLRLYALAEGSCSHTASASTDALPEVPHRVVTRAFLVSVQ
ncbi:MAG: hypothetical protein ACK4SY_00610 [Pyrobaculum sp.]